MRYHFKFGPVVWSRCCLKFSFYFKVWGPFCSAERNHLCNFGRGYCCEFFFEFGQIVQKITFKDCFLFLALMVILFSGAEPFVQFW